MKFALLNKSLGGACLEHVYRDSIIDEFGGPMLLMHIPEYRSLSILKSVHKLRNSLMMHGRVVEMLKKDTHSLGQGFI